jgi:hypothetical protein
LVIAVASVSSLHALIEWRPPGVWEIKDLGSRNGTWLNSSKIPTGTWRRLARGDQLGFGDELEPWTITDVERPLAEARCMTTGERRHAGDQILTLSEDPRDWVDLIEERPGVWLIERLGVCEPVADGAEIIVVGGQQWRVQLPVVSPPTEPLLAEDVTAPQVVALEFRVSADLEYIQMHVRVGLQDWTTSRAYTRGMLEMARARLADASLHADERGWVYSDELCSLAGYESESRLNVEVHRARSELSRFGIPSAARLIQRRRGTGQLRIATDALRIVEQVAH